MRIVHLVSDLSRAGTQRQVMIVARGQAALGHRVTILVAGPTYDLGPELDAAGLRWMAIPQVSRVRLPLKLGGVINYALIVGTLLRLRPQIVHSHGFLTHHRRLAMTARRLTGVRLVHKEVNVPGCFPEHYRAVAAELAARTGCIVANCRAVRDALVAELGYDPAKIQVVYNALDMEGYRVVDAPTDPPTVGIIGRFDPEKRHEDFLEAAALVAAEHPTVRFLIFGREEGATAVRGICCSSLIG